MDPKDQEFLKRLRATFRTEAEEHISALSAGFIELEKTTKPDRQVEIVECLFREVHSLKGAARSVNLKEIESICQPLESILAALKHQNISLSAMLIDLFHKAEGMLNQFAQSKDMDNPQIDRAHLRNLNTRLTIAAQGKAVPGEPDNASPTKMGQSPPAPMPAVLEPPAAITSEVSEIMPAMVETVRIPISRLDPLLLQAEEMIQAKLAADQRGVELRSIQKTLIDLKAEAAKWTDQGAAASNDLPQWVEVQLEALVGEVNAASQAFEQDQRTLRHMVDDHLEAMKQVLMLPVSTLVQVFPRLVRDLARDQGKEVELVIQGTDLEMDKRILEELKDPLIHLLRNCVDHGIEKPAARTYQGKAQRGVITLTFNAIDGRQAEIVVHDDGAGIDADQVRAAAVRSATVTAEATEKLSSPETMALIFQSGISTSEMITDISGRGLGLAIVHEKAEKLGGYVTVKSQIGAGTTFRLQLPLTLATFRGVLVKVREQVFVLPTTQVERVIRVGQDEIKTVENRETIEVNERILSLVRLGDVLELPLRSNNRGSESLNQGQTANHFPVLILASTEKRLAVQVDEVLAEEEVLVKGLGKQLSRVRNIAGATILGTGIVAPVLNVADLMKSVMRPGATIGVRPGGEKASIRAKRLMVAEDSITARTLLRNILETGGYQVATAVDGVDAFTKLRSGDFDLVVSDVDMPRMSGFELTTKIRGDEKLGELPVVLVTALESRQDRERGIDVGANAYIIKSSFDQSNLLEVIQQLL